MLLEIRTQRSPARMHAEPTNAVEMAITDDELIGIGVETQRDATLIDAAHWRDIESALLHHSQQAQNRP